MMDEIEKEEFLTQVVETARKAGDIKIAAVKKMVLDEASLGRRSYSLVDYARGIYCYRAVDQKATYILLNKEDILNIVEYFKEQGFKVTHPTGHYLIEW